MERRNIKSKSPIPSSKRKLVKKQKDEDVPKKKTKTEPQPQTYNSDQEGEPSDYDHHKGTEVAEWNNYELLSKLQDIDINVAKDVINMFENDCTIPFIARYRKDCTNNMSAEKLRDIKQCYEEINAIKFKSQKLVEKLKSKGNLTPEIRQSLLNAKTMEEIEFISAPFKTVSTSRHAKAKKLGVEETAIRLLTTTEDVDLHYLINTSVDELDNYEKIEGLIVDVISHIIATHCEVLEHVRKMRENQSFEIEVTKKAQRGAGSKKKAANGTHSKNNAKEDKYENYYDYKGYTKTIKTHQILAINRGELQNILKVKINVPEYFYKSYTTFCWNVEKWCSNVKHHHIKRKIFNKALEDSYKRTVQPLIIREIRSELKANAVKASLDVFCNNLKQLLLTSSVKGCPILGIDPGFTNGCKAAVIGSDGQFLKSGVLFPFKDNDKAANTLRKLLFDYSCTLIALGNGMACRKTESWLSDLISAKFFKPFDVQYTIINENGASIYSCSKEATKEFPDVDPNIISAISLARRVQDPLAEYVKVEPKHIGVGMYQHDLPKTRLAEALNEVVSECVSFVGVDLNTCSECLLRRVAGLSEKKASLIMDYRNKNGPFTNRQQLLSIKTIGKKTFEQCAGFLKICPVSAGNIDDFYADSQTNRLDRTIIHPESYDLTAQILEDNGLNLKDVGEERFIKKISTLTGQFDYGGACQKYKTSEHTLKLILENLSKSLNHDIRDDSSKQPIFKKELTNIADLECGTILTGKVTNNTHFGSFVDVGVGKDGLIHISKMNGLTLEIGNSVEVKVLTLDEAKGRLGLELLRIL